MRPFTDSGLKLVAIRRKRLSLKYYLLFKVSEELKYRSSNKIPTLNMI